MKILESNIQIDSFKILLTQNIFTTINKIKSNNRKCFLITPWTKISEFINFNKDSILKLIFESCDYNYLTNFIDIKKINNLINFTNNELNEELLDINLEYLKILKILITLNNDSFNNENLFKILTTINKYIDQKMEIIICGFNIKMQNTNFDKLDILYVVFDLTNKLNFNLLSSLVIIDSEDQVIEIEDVDSLISWLELKTRTVLTKKDINLYLSGETNFNSYLINKAFTSLL